MKLKYRFQNIEFYIELIVGVKEMIIDVELITKVTSGEDEDQLLYELIKNNFPQRTDNLFLARNQRFMMNSAQS